MWPKPLQTVGHAGGGRGQLEGQPRGELPRACPAGSDKSWKQCLLCHDAQHCPVAQHILLVLHGHLLI